MDITVNNNGHNIVIKEDVIARICVNALAGMDEAYTLDRAKKKKNGVAGVSVSKVEEKLNVTVDVVMQANTCVTDFAPKAQKLIKRAIDDTIGLETAEVNIHIVGYNNQPVEA